MRDARFEEIGRLRRALAAVIVLAGVVVTGGAAPAAAGPPIDDPPAPAKKPEPAPLVVPAQACSDPAAGALSMKALVAELTRVHTRLEDVKKEEAKLQAQRDKLEKETADAKESLEAERVDLDLRRQELESFRIEQDKPKGPSADDIAAVAGLIKKMRADKAAAVLERTDLTLATEVVRGMGRVSAAALLERLKPELAAQIAERLAKEPAK